MRIAIISEVFLPKIDGVVNRTLNLIRYLTHFGDEVLIVCPRAQGCSDCQVRVMDVPSFSFPLYPEYRIGLPDYKVAGAVKEFAPEVLHYINPFAFGFRCHDVFRRAGVRTPSVFSFHTLYGEFVKKYKVLRLLSEFLWWLMREYHNRADINMTVSTVMQQELVQRGFRRVELWPPAVDTDLFHPDRRGLAMRTRLSGGHPERPLLLTVSRLAPEKNVGMLADVLKQLPGTRLAVVGDGPDRAALEQRFAGLDATFVGYLKGEELAAAYASADVFVYASEMETMGNVVLESMAAGCPVVAPRAGGITSLLTHGETGLLYHAGDVCQAVRSSRQLLGDPELRTRVAHSARWAVQGQSWEMSVRRVRQVYADAIRDGNGRTSRVTWRDRLAGAATRTLVSLFRSLAPSDRKPSPNGHATPRLPELLAGLMPTSAGGRSTDS